jgi:hypothetical protein
VVILFGLLHLSSITVLAALHRIRHGPSLSSARFCSQPVSTRARKQALRVTPAFLLVDDRHWASCPLPRMVSNKVRRGSVTNAECWRTPCRSLSQRMQDCFLSLVPHTCLFSWKLQPVGSAGALFKHACSEASCCWSEAGAYVSPTRA